MKWNLWNRLFYRRAPRPQVNRNSKLRYQPQLVTLEDRVVPATISLVGGNLTYTGTNIDNTLGLTLSGGNYTFTNAQDLFTGAPPANVTYQNGNSEAVVSNANVNQITIILGTSVNTVNLGSFNAAIDPLSVTGGSNAGSTLSVLAGGSGITTTGNVSFTGFNSISVLNQITAAGVTLAADQMTISQDVDAGTGTIAVSTTTAGRQIRLGAASSGTQLGFTQAQLSNFFAGLLSVGTAGTGGPIDIAANSAFNAADVDTLSLLSGSTISGAGTLSVDELQFNATGNVTLTGTWDTVAGASSGSITLTNSQDLTVGSVNGINGVTGNGDVSITVQGADNLLTVAQDVQSTAGNVTLTSDRQTIGNNVDAPGHRVTLQPTTAARLIDLGGADSATELGLLPAELNQVTASILQVGRSNAGNLSVSAAVAPAGISTLTLMTGGSATGASEINVGQLRFDATAGPVNLTGNWNTVAGSSDGNVTLNNNQSLTIGTVDGFSGIQSGGVISITVRGSLTVAGNVTSSAASAVTLTTIDLASAGQNITVNTGVSVSSAGGAVTLNAGDDLTVSSGATLQSSGAGQLFLRVDFTSADGAGGDLQSVDATLSAPAGTSMLGAGDNDQFTISSSSNTAISVNGNAGNNSLTFNASGLATTISGNTLTATGRQPVTFTNINVNPIQLVNTTSVAMLGSAGADNLTLFGTAGGVEASLTGGPRFTIGALPFSFDGQGGANSVTFDYLNGNAVPAGGTTIANVTSYTVMGSNGVDLVELLRQGGVTGYTLGANPFVALTGITSFAFHGRQGNDVLTVRYGNLVADDPVPALGVDYFGEGDDDALAVISPLAPGRTGQYLPSATTFGDGVVTVGAGNIRFSSLAPVDVTGFASFTALFPNNNDTITLAPGLAFTVAGQPAIRMTGTSGAVPVAFESLAIWNVTNFTIDTTTVQGVDDITIAGTGASGSHDVDNITITTGDNDDDVDVTAPIDLSGSLTFNLGNNSDTLDSTSTISLGGNLVMNTGDGTNTVTLGVGTTTTVGNNVVITGGTGADDINSNGSLNVTGSLTANLGGSGDEIDFAATTVGGAITVDGQGGSDVVRINGVTSGSSVSITSETINITANLTSNTTTVQLLSVDNLNVAGVTVSGRTGITQTGAANATVLTGVGPVLTQFVSPLGFINLGSNINATTANVQQLSVNAQTDATLQNIGNNTRLGSISVTSSAGDILLQGSTYAGGPQNYTTLTSQATVVSAAAVTFDGAATEVRFSSPLRGNVAGASAVTVNTTGNTIFQQAVGSTALQSLTTNAGGTTRINGSAVTTTLNQDYQDDVVLTSPVDLTTMTTLSGGSIDFNQTLNAGDDCQNITLDTGAGAIFFDGNVGTGPDSIGDLLIVSAGNVQVGAAAANLFTVTGLNQLAGSGVTTFNAVTDINNDCGSAFAIIANITNNAIVLNNTFSSAQDTRFNANTAGTTQTTGTLTTTRLLFAGTGDFTLDQLGNVVFADFQANIDGKILLAAQNLTISQAGVVTSNDDVTLRTAFDFTATPVVAGGQLINLGAGNFQLFHGLSGDSEVVFKSEITAATVNLGAPPLTPLVNQNNNKDEYTIRPSANVKIKVWGNIPLNNAVTALNDVITMDFSDLPANEPINLVSNELVAGSGSFEGTFSFPLGSRKDVYYHSIEEIGKLRMVANVFQTVAGQAKVVLGAKISDYNINFLMPSVNIPVNAFVVNPKQVNPKAPFSAPRIAMGDVNGDGSDDLVLAAGSNRSPMVIVVDGKKLTQNALGGGALDNITTLPRDFYLAQFLAYESTFMGGLYVAVGKMDPTDGSPVEQIVIGPGSGRAPQVRVFTFNGVNDIVPYRDPLATDTGDLAFMAYESTFKGGVRVAVRDTGDGTRNEIITGPGTGRPSTLRVFKNSLTSSSTPTMITQYAPYSDISPTFKGGLHFDTGDYDLDGKEDILVGPGVGLNARVRVFKSNTTTKLVDFVAFNTERPSSLVSLSSLKVGVGGVSFSRDTSGKLGILVGSGPGLQTQVRFFSNIAPVPLLPPFGTASNPNIFTIFPTEPSHTGNTTLSITGGTWTMIIKGKKTPALSHTTTAAQLLATLNAPTMTNNNVLTVTGSMATGFIITFKETYVATFLPSITIISNLVGTLEKEVNNIPVVLPVKPQMAGAFSGSTKMLKDFVGNYFRYDTVLISALALFRYRDGAQSVVAAK